MSEREFKDTFTQAGEIFLYPEGIVALPLLIDPLVMYWNRDLFTNADIVSPPVYWKDILSMTGKLTKKKNLDVLQSTIALGEYENIDRAKDILSLMFLQVGSPITQVTRTGLQSALGQNTALIQAIRFYVDFANPLKSSYSWNRSLQNSQDAFLANDVAMYIDLASAYTTLLSKNPRLNFDLAPVPQTEGQENVVTYGKIHALAVMKKGKNVAGGYAFARLFSTRQFVDLLSKGSGMAPMRRDLLSVPQSDAYKATLYTAALRARSWVDPQPIKSNAIFSRMIESVLSGKVIPEIAVSQANTEMSLLINPQ
jgi:ABC-type glycerol-3-phosphate transport system substrate-binding protein